MQLNRGQPDLEDGASEVDQGDLRSVRSNSISATTAALLGAALTVLGGLVGALITGYFQTEATVGAEQKRGDAALELERLKFETGLILKALETPAQAEAVKRLKFFAKAGLIPRYKKEVLEIAEEDDGAAIPTLTQQTAPMEPITGDLTRLAGPLGRLMLDDHDICSGAMLKPWHFLTVDDCVKELHDPSKLRVRWRPRSPLQQVDKIVLLSDGFALLTLRGEPPPVGGIYLDLSKARDPRPDEPLYIIHYALGQKVLSRFGCKASGEPVENNNFRYRSNTAGSGSGIIFSAVDEAPLGLVYRNGVPDALGFSDEAKRLSGLEPKIVSAISPPP